MTHKEIIKAASQGNVVFLSGYVHLRTQHGPSVNKYAAPAKTIKNDSDRQKAESQAFRW